MGLLIIWRGKALRCYKFGEQSIELRDEKKKCKTHQRKIEMIKGI